mgnify:CR=1 FL=1
MNASLFDENSANRAYNFRPLSYHDPNAPEKPKNTKESATEVDPDMHFCRLLRENGVFMYVSNLPDNFGHLARLETYDLSRRHPDFYEIYSNEIDWRRRYIHPNYSAALLNESIIEQPCPDVYWFPVGSPAFCQHLIGKKQFEKRETNICPDIRDHYLEAKLTSVFSLHFSLFPRNHGALWTVVGRQKLRECSCCGKMCFLRIT